jgi:glycine dehydrogenase
VSTSAAPFADRHIGPSRADVEHMLANLGLSSLDELIDQAVPAAIRDDKPLELDAAISEADAIARLRALADRNEVLTSLIGAGYYGTHTPGVILRNVLENPAWYTAYTPYQPEISQGRLEALLNFQTMVCDLTGMEIANASMLDEGTAAAEAMTLARRSTRHDGDAFFVDAECHPQTIAVVATRAEPLGIPIVVGDPATDLVPGDVFGVLLQHPGTSGVVRDLRPVIDAVHEAGALAVVSTDLLACTLLVPPGELGADVAVGSSQRFGVPMGFGGPHAGFLATRDAFRRSLPGRLVGVSVDAAGRPAHRLALQTREQHIRREKATSNICTAQVLLAVMASMYAVYHGPDGLSAIARGVHAQATAVARRLRDAGVDLIHDTWFDTLTVRTPGQAAEITERARQAGLNLRRFDGDRLGLAFDETTAPVLSRLLAAFGIDTDPADLAEAAEAAAAGDGGIPAAEARTSEFLTHPVFHAHRSETDMLRYLRGLADKDVALDRAMIPLGSCTMKLNATNEMEPVTWPEFAAVHPFAPLDQAEGYRELIEDLETTLARITGFDAVSLQPNAGSQGELAGLLAIREYHRSRGDDERDVCLIPASAHGTNAASAVMAGMRVVVVACDDGGNVDMADFRAKAGEHGDRLAALMVTYPSTHGVFESTIVEICDVVHEHGGQVYVDGANLNALVGVARPGWFGGDVSHLNLHKTFCIPHGGGGPGVGPVAARAQLAPFLPNHPATPDAGPATGPGPVSAAPWGSAGILPISYSYAKLMGAEGLRRATQVAILSANYIAARLGDHYPVLYTGEHGRVAHECIVDIRPITKATGVTVDDVAKRLIDYGFHAPTMSFPVAGTLMIEPTESESLAEVDRFCDAMIAIKGEIDRVASGEWPHADSPLHHAPHTAEDLLVAEWDRPYSREDAAYPVPALRRSKYWPPVSRIDGGYGDRNLICACPPPEAFE